LRRIQRNFSEIEESNYEKKGKTAACSKIFSLKNQHITIDNRFFSKKMEQIKLVLYIWV